MDFWIDFKVGRKAISDDREIVEEPLVTETAQLTSFSGNLRDAHVCEELHRLLDLLIDDSAKKLDYQLQLSSVERTLKQA